MSFITERYTVRQIARVFLIGALPVYIWAIVNLLKEVPSWVLSMDTWELAGIIAYQLAFALFETLVLLIGVMLLDMVLLFPWKQNNFAVRGSMVVLLASTLSISLYLTGAAPYYWRRRQFILLGGLFVVSVVLTTVLVQRFPRVESAILAVVDKLIVLSVVYVFVGFLSVLIVIIRNA